MIYKSISEWFSAIKKTLCFERVTVHSVRDSVVHSSWRKNWHQTCWACWLSGLAIEGINASQQPKEPSRHWDWSHPRQGECCHPVVHVLTGTPGTCQKSWRAFPDTCEAPWPSQQQQPGTREPRPASPVAGWTCLGLGRLQSWLSCLTYYSAARPGKDSTVTPAQQTRVLGACPTPPSLPCTGAVSAPWAQGALRSVPEPRNILSWKGHRSIESSS